MNFSPFGGPLPSGSPSFHQFASALSQEPLTPAHSSAARNSSASHNSQMTRDWNSSPYDIHKDAVLTVINGRPSKFPQNGMPYGLPHPFPNTSLSAFCNTATSKHCMPDSVPVLQHHAFPKAPSNISMGRGDRGSSKESSFNKSAADHRNIHSPMPSADASSEPEVSTSFALSVPSNLENLRDMYLGQRQTFVEPRSKVNPNPHNLPVSSYGDNAKNAFHDHNQSVSQSQSKTKISDDPPVSYGGEDMKRMFQSQMQMMQSLMQTESNVNLNREPPVSSAESTRMQAHKPPESSVSEEVQKVIYGDQLQNLSQKGSTPDASYQSPGPSNGTPGRNTIQSPVPASASARPGMHPSELCETVIRDGTNAAHNNKQWEEDMQNSSSASHNSKRWEEETSSEQQEMASGKDVLREEVQSPKNAPNPNLQNRTQPSPAPTQWHTPKNDQNTVIENKTQPIFAPAPSPWQGQQGDQPGSPWQTSRDEQSNSIETKPQISPAPEHWQAQRNDQTANVDSKLQPSSAPKLWPPNMPPIDQAMMQNYLSRFPQPPGSFPLSLQLFKYSREAAKKTEGSKKKRKSKATTLQQTNGGAVASPISSSSEGSISIDGCTLYCCPQCHIAYPSKEQLDRHMVTHQSERPYVCEICGTGLKRKEHLDRHRLGHNQERPYVCTICMKAFKRNEHLSRHYVVHSGDKDFLCPECGKAFTRKDHLNKHTLTHLAKRIQSEMGGPQNASIPLPLVARFICPECGKAFSRKDHLHKHTVRTHIAKRLKTEASQTDDSGNNMPIPLVSQEASDSFKKALEKTFLSHMNHANIPPPGSLPPQQQQNEHVGHRVGPSEERPYVCTVCTKAFKREEHLSRHSVIHSGDKKFICSECGKAFFRKDHLNKHTLTHLAKRIQSENSEGWSSRCQYPATSDGRGQNLTTTSAPY